MSIKTSYTKNELRKMSLRAKRLLNYYKNPSESSKAYEKCPLCYHNIDRDSCRKCYWNYGKRLNESGRCEHEVEHIQSLREGVALYDRETKKYFISQSGIINLDKFRNKRIRQLSKFINEIDSLLQ